MEIEIKGTQNSFDMPTIIELPGWSNHHQAFPAHPLISYPEEVVLNLIRKSGALSKVDLVDQTEYSRSKITGCINSLLEKKYIVETGAGENTGGRRSVLFSVNGSLGLILGADIGATSLDLMIADLSGEHLARYSEPALVQNGPIKILNRICDKFDEMLVENGLSNRTIMGFGIGVPGPVDFALGTVVSPPIMPGWDQFPIIQFILQRFPDTIVVVDNDVNIMALGEHAKGIGVGIKNLIFVKIGTGIGAGIICEGNIYRGTSGCAGDIGHICVDKSGPVCPCGNHGCLEVLAGGAAIANRAIKDLKDGRSPILLKYYKKREGNLTSEDVGNAAKEGDTSSIEIIRDSGRIIGDVLAGLVNFTNPEMIIIGGGVSKMGNLLLSSIRQSILKRSLPLATKDLAIVFSSIIEDAGVIGAINLAMDLIFSSQIYHDKEYLQSEIV